MRDVPDWRIQVAWWVSGVFATGAAWYFLSTDKAALAAASGAVALLFVGIAIYLHRQKDAFAAKLVPDELKDDLPDDYVRRTSAEEAHVRLVRSLPEMRAVVQQSVLQGWSSPRTLDMREASYDMIEFLQGTWLRLAEFYPRKHFDSEGARAFIERYVRTRFAFHWAKHEPGGPGSGGTIVSVLSGGDVVHDLDTLIKDTMRSLFFDNQFVDLENWLSRWEAASRE